jgi:hypothetical protein
MGSIDIQRDAIGFDELNEVYPQTQDVLMRVAGYSQPIRELQIVCNHPTTNPQSTITDH